MGLHLFAHLFAHKMIFPAPSSSYQALPDLFWMPSACAENGLASVYLEAPNPHGVILYCHGNAEDLGSLYPVLKQYQDRGYSILAYDYPGYGMTGGDASEKNCQQAVLEAYDYLFTEKQIDPKSIYAYGRSLGGGSAFYLASRKELGGLLVEGTFTSTYRVMSRYQLLKKDCFDNLALLPHVHCPFMVFHGKLDRTVPFWHGQKLFEKYTGKRKQSLWLDNAGHNNVIEVGGECYWEALCEFISTQNPH